MHNIMRYILGDTVGLFLVSTVMMMIVPLKTRFISQNSTLSIVRRIITLNYVFISAEAAIVHWLKFMVVVAFTSCTKPMRCDMMMMMIVPRLYGKMELSSR